MSGHIRQSVREQPDTGYWKSLLSCFAAFPIYAVAVGRWGWDRLLALVGEEDPVVVQVLSGSGFEACEEILYGEVGALFAAYIQDDIAVGHQEGAAA